MYRLHPLFLVLAVVSSFVKPCSGTPIAAPAFIERYTPHHPAIPNALPQAPAPPRRDTNIYSAELVAYLERMPVKSPVLLEELVNLLQTAWKAQMDFLAWYEIIKPPRSTRSVAESSFGEEVDERTDEADRDEGTRAEKRSLKWVSPGEKARWAEDCRWLRKVARKITFNFGLPASPLAMFPGSDEDICNILEA